MSPYPKHYLPDVPQELRLKVLDLCIHREWHDALDLLHQNGFTQYEWYELVWFHDHAPTNLDVRSTDGPSAWELPLRAGDLSDLGSNERNSPEAKVHSGPSERARASHWARGEVPSPGVPCSDGPADPETLTVGRAGPGEPNLNTTTPQPNLNEPNLNGVPVKVPKPRSKIGRLPKDIQDNLNTMLARGCPYAEVIRCLNDHGYPGFNKVNLHTWKQTGLLNWHPDSPQDLEGHQKVSEGVQKPVEGDSR